jgi:hypothetical protein
MKIEKQAVIYGGFEIRVPWNIGLVMALPLVTRANWMAEMEL